MCLPQLPQLDARGPPPLPPPPGHQQQPQLPHILLCGIKVSVFLHSAPELENSNPGVQRVQIFRFSVKKKLSLGVQIRNNLENIILIACKLCKLFQYYVNSMVTSCSTCQKEEKECTLVKYVIYAVLPQFQFFRNLRNFYAKS